MNRIYLYPLLGLLLVSQLSSAQGIKIMPGTTFKLIEGPYNLVLSGNYHLENNAPITGSYPDRKRIGRLKQPDQGNGCLKCGPTAGEANLRARR